MKLNSERPAGTEVEQSGEADANNVQPPYCQTPCCVHVPCYNCGSTERDFYLVVGDWLYEDVQGQLTEQDELVEMEICKQCGACQ